MIAPQVQLSRFREPPEQFGGNGPPGSEEDVPVRRQLIQQALEDLRNANPSPIALVGTAENVVRLQELLGAKVLKGNFSQNNERKLMTHISKKKFGDDTKRSCQESHPDLYMWLSKTSPVPATVVTKMRPEGWKATKRAKLSAQQASNKQRRERTARLKVVGGRDLSRAPKSVTNSGEELDQRSALAVNASHFNGMFQRLMSLQYHVEYEPGSYDSGNGESSLPSIACSKTAEEKDLQVINELQEEFRKLALKEATASTITTDEAVQRGYGTSYTMTTAGERFLAENTGPVSVKSTSYEATRYRLEGDKANVHLEEFLRYQDTLEKMSILNGEIRSVSTFTLNRIAEIKALARMCWKTIGEVPPLSRKEKKHLVNASKREMKQNLLDTACLIDNSNKVKSITGSPLTSSDNTLCVAAKYQLFLWEHDEENKHLHAERYDGVFEAVSDDSCKYYAWLRKNAILSCEDQPDPTYSDRRIEFMYQRRIKHVLPNRYHANAMKAKYGLEDSDMKVPAVKEVQPDKPVQRSDYVHESDYVMAARRNKVVTSITLKVDTPWKSVQGPPSSLEAANDPIIPVKAQEVCGPQMTDEVAEMRNKRQRYKSNLSVFKKGGMSRARARIAMLEEAKYKISTFNASEDESTLIYMPPEKGDVVNEVHDKEWADKFVKEFTV